MTDLVLAIAVALADPPEPPPPPVPAAMADAPAIRKAIVPKTVSERLADAEAKVAEIKARLDARVPVPLAPPIENWPRPLSEYGKRSR